MGLALARGFAQSNSDVEVGFFDPAVENADFRKFASLPDLAQWAQTLFLAVKPQVCGAVCGQLAGFLRAEHLLVSIAAGVDAKRLESFLAESEAAKLQRFVVAMPNTPMMVRQGVCCYYCGAGVSASEEQFVHNLFAGLGLAKKVSPKLMDAVPAISGSAPAYVYLLIRAMGEAGVEQGFSADDAYELAAQTVLGSAKMVLSSKEHPAVLQDKVCSPGGSTIEAVLRLQQEGFASAVQRAMQDCTNKIKKMKKDES